MKIHTEFRFNGQAVYLEAIEKMAGFPVQEQAGGNEVCHSYFSAVLYSTQMQLSPMFAGNGTTQFTSALQSGDNKFDAEDVLLAI